MYSKLMRMFDDIHRLANAVTANRMTETLVVLSPQDRDAIIDALVNFRRRKPKKETV